MSAPVSKQQLDAAVKQLAARDRPRAVEILARFNVLTTATLPPEKWRAVFNEFEAELAARNIASTP